MTLPPGTLFGAYRIRELLGQGSLGEVYRAHQPDQERDVALKVIRRLPSDEWGRPRFLREAGILQRLVHPNIVPLYDVGEVDGQPYLASRYLSGGPLNAQEGASLPPAQVVALLASVAAALDFAHSRGFVHGDIKPANLVFGDADAYDRRTPLITDFGLARLVGPPDMDLGTLAYTAPEYLLKQYPREVRVDQYSLAVLAFQLLTGSLPFRAATPREIFIMQVTEPAPTPSVRLPSLSSAIDAVVLRALEKNPAARFSTCSAFVSALQTAAT